MSVEGVRVLRGPDWRGGDTDGGEGYVGTVIQLLSNHRVLVLWDMGQESTCSTGADGKFDLRAFDTAQIGVCHPTVKCADCGDYKIYGMVWRCQDCAGCDLCTPCYSDDKHDQRHKFLRIDTPESKGDINVDCIMARLTNCSRHPVPKRKTSVKTRAIGLFPGSKVTRGKDWQWDDQDGGQGSEGEVKGYENVSPVSSRNLVRVQWSHGGANSYRLGFHGKVDLLCVEEEVGPFYYRDHLPVLDTTMQFQPKALPTNAVPPTTSSDASCLGTAAVSDVSPGHMHSDNSAFFETDGTIKCTETTSSSLDKSVNDSARDEGYGAHSDTDWKRKDSGIGIDAASKHNSVGGDVGTERLLKSHDSLLSADETKLKTEEGSNVVNEEFFASGDKVTIKTSGSTLMELQKDYGGCTEGLIKMIGHTGEVVAVSENDTVSASFQSVFYNFNPRALMKIPLITDGINVRIRDDEEEVKLLNKRIGWKEEMQHTIGKVGRVLKLDRDGDALVSFGRHVFLFAPACCIPAPDVKPDSLKIESDRKPPLPAARTISNDEHVISPLTLSKSSTRETQELYHRLREAIQKDSKPSGMRMNINNLYVAIKRGDHATVREICMANKSLIDKEFQELTPLMWACVHGRQNLQVVQTLLELGADANHGILPSKTPLYACLQGKCEEMVELVLQAGADPFAVDENLRTYIHYAAVFNLPGSIQRLAAIGVDVNIKDDNKDTALHLAIVESKQEAVAALVHHESIDLRAQNRHDFDGLHLSCLRGNARATELILERDKSTVNHWHHGKNTPLHTAATNDHDQCIRFLSRLGGANLNLQDNAGAAYTPLHQACIRAKLKAVEALLEMGAEVNLQDARGDTALHLTIGGRHERDSGSERSQQECQRRVAMASMLIAKGAYVDMENMEGRDPFTYGVRVIREGVRRFMKHNEGLVKRKDRSSGIGANIKSTTLSQVLTASLPQDQGHCQLKEALKGVGLPCGLCGTTKSDVILQPCQHKCVCSACSVKVTTCPLCDEEVKDKVVTAPDEQTLDLDALKKM